MNGNSIIVDSTTAAVSGSKVTITFAGNYDIRGSLTDGQIIVNTKNDGIVRLILNGINVTCSNSAPIYIAKAEKTLIVLADNTESFLVDGTSYILDADNEPNATIYSKSYLSFFGKGSLTVNANYNDGITSKDGLVIKSGSFNISSADDGIRGKDYLLLRSGNIIINSKGDGMKSDNDEDTSLGFITIDSAVVNITTTSGDGINARTNLKINDGSYTITTGGGAGTTASRAGTPNVGGDTGSSGGYSGTTSEKALKAKTSLIIEKGTFIINAADDALHSNGTVAINGGTISIASRDVALRARSGAANPVCAIHAQGSPRKQFRTSRDQFWCAPGRRRPE